MVISLTQQQQQLIIIIIIITSGPRVTPVLGECRKQLIDNNYNNDNNDNNNNNKTKPQQR